MLFFKFLIILVVAGCGYTLNHRLKDAFTDKRGIFVPVFKNLTHEFGAERVFTNALIHELANHREVVMAEKRHTGLEMHGELIKITLEPTAHTEYGFRGLHDFQRIPSEYRVRVELNLSLRDSSNGSVVWANSFSGFRRVNVDISRTFDYEAPSSVGPSTYSLINSVYNDIASDMMRDVYDDMVALF